ncbi:MAG: MurR/RpiR family transcriptional regulator [Rhodobacterales bacterium]|nr:MurR/RpiR family transcriptional regulator [Rhodobacterales bacterium]
MPDTQNRPKPPLSLADLRDRIADLSGKLPRVLQQCADHLVADHDSIAVSTVAELSARAGVPPSAMMRFCHLLGFSGYSELQRLYRTAVARGLPDYATRLANLKSGPAGHPAALVAEFVEAGRLSLEGLARDLDETTLDQAVKALSQAAVIHLVGYRRALPVAVYLSYVFEKLGIATFLHDGLGGLDHRSALRPGDAVLAITFAPYSAETLALVDRARAIALPVVLLTDPPATALRGRADLVLTVGEVDFGAFRSLSATIALALALAVAVAARREG